MANTIFSGVPFILGVCLFALIGIIWLMCNENCIKRMKRRRMAKKIDKIHRRNVPRH